MLLDHVELIFILIELITASSTSSSIREVRSVAVGAENGLRRGNSDGLLVGLNRTGSRLRRSGRWRDRRLHGVHCRLMDGLRDRLFRAVGEGHRGGVNGRHSWRRLGERRARGRGLNSSSSGGGLRSMGVIRRRRSACSGSRGRGSCVRHRGGGGSRSGGSVGMGASGSGHTLASRRIFDAVGSTLGVGAGDAPWVALNDTELH